MDPAEIGLIKERGAEVFCWKNQPAPILWEPLKDLERLFVF
jgi:hypothetical protein